MVDDIKVNLSTNMTEKEQIDAKSRIFLRFTPVWFNWLEWVIIIGAIQLIAVKTNDISVKLILISSYLFLYLHMMEFSLHLFIRASFIKFGKKWILISFLLSTLVGLSTFLLLAHLIAKLN